MMDDLDRKVLEMLDLVIAVFCSLNDLNMHSEGFLVCPVRLGINPSYGLFGCAPVTAVLYEGCIRFEMLKLFNTGNELCLNNLCGNLLTLPLLTEGVCSTPA